MARLTGSGVALVVVTLIMVLRPELLNEVSVELIRLAAVLPDAVQILVVGTTQVLALVTAVGIVVAALMWRRWSVILPAVLSAIVAVALTALTADWASRTLPKVPIQLPRPTWLIGETFPSAAFLAAVVAMVVTLSPTWNRKWRRTAWWGVALVALSRILTAAVVPVGIVSAILLGTTIGSTALLIFGIPRLRPRPEEIIETLDQLGIPVLTVTPAPESYDGQLRYIGERDEPDPLTVNGPDEVLEVLLIDANDRAADMFARATRALRVRGTGDDQAGLSPDRIAEHTALVTLLAQSMGVPVSKVVAMGELHRGTRLIALTTPHGENLSSINADEMDQDVLRSAWRSLHMLHSRRIAHRRARRDQVVVTATGQAIWTGLRYGTVGAEDEQLALDTAEFLVSTAVAVGPERAVDAAVAELPAADLSAALPLMQQIILTSETRRELGRKNDLVDRTRDLLQERIDAEPFELTPLQRITPGRLAALVIGTLLAYIALSFASDLSAVSDALSQFSWSYLPALVFFAALTYPLLALSTMGAAPIPIPFLQMSLVALAQSLLNKFTPANAGGMALRVRYLQKMGMDIEPAATTLGLTSAFSGVAQMIVLVVFGIWAGSTGDLDLRLPTSLIAPAIVVITVAGSLIYLTPWGRRMWSAKLLPPLKRAWPVITELFRSPNKLAILLSSNIADKLSTIGAFVVAVNAIGIDSSFAQLGFLYMTANTVAGAAPTPGGIGAIEAALTAALTATGVPTAQALSAVLVFRLATFWIPIPFGGIALARVRKKGLV